MYVSRCTKNATFVFPEGVTSGSTKYLSLVRVTDGGPSGPVPPRGPVLCRVLREEGGFINVLRDGSVWGSPLVYPY